MSGTMVSDGGYLNEKTTYRMTAHRSGIVRGDVLAIDFSVVDADSGLADTLKDATINVVTEVLCVALEDIPNGEKGLVCTRGHIEVQTDAVVAAGTPLSVDVGTVDRLDDAEATLNTAAKIVGFNQAIIGSAGLNLIYFDGEAGFGFDEDL